MPWASQLFTSTACSQELRKLRLINLESRHLTVLDWPRLQEVGDFDAGYLHLPKTAT